MGITLPPILVQLLQKPSLSFAIISLLLALYRISSKKPKRLLKVAKSGERVLILGASSGVGRSVARQYAARGARACVVGRRESLVEEVAVECRNAQTCHISPIARRVGCTRRLYECARYGSG